MASGSHQYTLAGFSQEVDRRPLFFVKPLPAANVCSACCIVPKLIVLLQCAHYFCKACYEQCRSRGGVTCPLDGEACLENEATWMSDSTGSVMAMKVLCWNHPKGCNVVTAAANISEHFHHECGHHSARCSKCATEILARDVRAHLESLCDAPRVTSVATVQQTPTVTKEQKATSITCSAVSNGFKLIYDAFSKDMSSMQTQLNEITQALKIRVADTASDDRKTDEGNLQTGIVQEILSQMMKQMAKLQYQVDHFMQNASANQQTFYNSFVEKTEELKQSLSEAVQSRVEQSELAVQLPAFRVAIEKRNRETNDDLLASILLAMENQYDRIRELVLTTNACQETKPQNSLDAAVAYAENLAQNASKIPWAKNGPPEDTRNLLSRFPSLMPVATTHTWAFNCASLMERAKKVPFTFGKFNPVNGMVEPVYLRGYCVSVGIRIYADGDLGFLFQLHKGRIDQFLEWPFNLSMKFSILHPHKPERLDEFVAPSKFPFFKDRFSRPVKESNHWIPVFGKFFSSAELKERGFNKRDRMLLSLTLDHLDDVAP